MPVVAAALGVLLAAAPGGPSGAAAGGVDPEPVPSGLDLLYGDRVAFTGSGEPLVTVGVASGEPRVTLRAKSALQVDFWEAGVQKRASVRPGEAIVVALQRSTPAARQFYVDLEGVPLRDPAALAAALRAWKARGQATVTPVEEGMVLGMQGRVLDNREYRLVLDARDRGDAERLAAAVYQRHGVRAEVKARLLERPWGELAVRAGGGPLGMATSYVRLVAAGGVIQVDGVEFARGYAWHGREDRTYRGEMYVAVDPAGTLAVVNVLGAEALLEGVVPAELYASSPAEALKAQAVAARNHLLSKLGRRHHDDPYRICAEQHCQVYAGIAKEDPRASAAVRATTGLALFSGDHLVECAYSASCGGHTEDNDAVWSEAPDPALRGQPDFDPEQHPELAAFAGPVAGSMPAWIATVPDSYCARAAAGKPDRIRWTRRIAAPELQRMVGSLHPEIGTLRDIVVDERGPGGRVESLRLVGTRGSASILRELTVRKLFGNLNSGAFVVEPSRDDGGALTAVTFRGAGWGHGVGMCQLGAVGRAQAGQTYEQILGHYYSGARLERLY